MKRKGYIFDKIVEMQNLEVASRYASKGKRKRNDVKRFYKEKKSNLENIQRLLKEKEYVPSPYTERMIKDGANQKERKIFKPQFYPDQIIHWALMLQLEPIIMKGMYQYNCASVEGRGIIYGMKYLKKILVKDKKNTKYCLKIDIKKFYPSINKEILKKKFEKKIKDKDTIWLIKKIVDSNKEGLPIGNYTSQWFANFYLQDLDHYIKERLKVKYYIRYMDDIVILSGNKKQLHKLLNTIKEFLKRDCLQVKENWQIFKLTSQRPIDFLGYRFYRGYTTLRRRNFLRIRRRMKKIYKKQELSYLDACAIVSYYGWVKHSDSYNYVTKYMLPYVSFKKAKKYVSYYTKKNSVIKM